VPVAPVLGAVNVTVTPATGLLEASFTTADIFTALEALDPKRDWRSQSIHSHISRLRNRGLIRRLQRPHGHEPAVYVRLGVQGEPLDDKTLSESVADLLRERGPLRAGEIAVFLMERGYRTTATPKTIRGSVGRVLRAGAYRKQAGKWACA